MRDNKKLWALILGASSGFGEAAARALARAGYDIFGVHLDRRATRPEDVAAAIVALAQPGTYWITGNVIGVDGGEDIVS